MAQAVIDASSFISSLGVNVHMNFTGTPYQNVSAVQNSMNYLGLTNMRDLGVQHNSVYDTLANAGYHFDFLVPGGAVNLGADMQWFDSFATAHPGSIVALEGPNEVNNWPVSYNGLTGYSAAVAVQNALFKAVNADPKLSNIPVVNLSMGVDNSAAYAPLGNLSAAADYGNVHLYTPYGAQPGATFQHYLSIGQTDTPGLPMRITETGYRTDPTNASGVDEATQAKLTVNMLMDSAKFGISATYLYQLVDHSSTDHWGLFRNDWSAKPAAVAIHDMTQILSTDPASIIRTPTAPGYTLSGANSNDSSLVFHEKGGTYDIVVWSEPKIWNSSTHTEVAAAPHAVTINLSQAVGGYSIYDPLTGTAAVSTSNTQTQQITLNVTDHPLIVELHGSSSTGGSTPPSSTTPTSPPPTGGTSGTSGVKVISGTAGNDDLHGTVGNDSISALGGDDRLYSGGAHDSMVGGAGHDQFVLDFRPGAGAAQINDFTPQTDMIDLLRSDFANLGSPGYLASQAFYQGTGPHAAADRIIYDPKSGNLMYDADGSGPSATSTIAHLTPGLSLNNHAFLVV